MVGISDLLDSEVEDSRDALEESVLSNATNRSTAKPRKKRRCVTMPPRAKSKVAKTAAAEKKRPATKRTAAAKAKAVEEHIEEVTDADGDEIQETQALSPKQRARGSTKRTAATRAETQDESGDEAMEVDQTPVVVQSSHAAVRGRKAVARPVHKDAEPAAKAMTTSKRKAELLQETNALVDSEDEMQISENLPPKNASRAPSRSHTTDGFRRRAGSASDTERGDPNLRRKLGDITRKYENIDLKYRNLREVGVIEANANMDKLRKQNEAATQASAELIASLKKEISQQAPLVQESRKLKKQVQTNELELVELRKANSTMSTNLTSAQNEIKALQAKLAATRSASVAADSRPPGSAMRQQNPARVGPGQAADATLAAQMKEELYRDLTGLIVQGVKRSEEGDTYNCYQTGRNGTLHFKLFIDAEEANNASFLQTEFLYTPLLEANRDADMMECMPSYLTEEITFAREDASKFYCRVLDTLTKRRVDEA